jgi:hypothetical protein
LIRYLDLRPEEWMDALGEQPLAGIPHFVGVVVALPREIFVIGGVVSMDQQMLSIVLGLHVEGPAAHFDNLNKDLVIAKNVHQL